MEKKDSLWYGKVLSVIPPEQLYVIARMEDALNAPLVPESELDRRINLAFGEGIPNKWDWSKEKEILLHGKE